MVDGANGVGAPKLGSLMPYLNGMLGIEITNDGSSGKLNHMASRRATSLCLIFCGIYWVLMMA